MKKILIFGFLICFLISCATVDSGKSIKDNKHPIKTRTIGDVGTVPMNVGTKLNVAFPIINTAIDRVNLNTANILLRAPINNASLTGLTTLEQLKLSAGGVTITAITSDGTYIHFWSGLTELATIPGSSGSTWGTITGTLSSQNDLTSALNAKAPVSTTMTTSHAANAITSTDITHWGLAYGWGNHASAGYIAGTRTVNGHPLSSNVTVTAADLNLGYVTNESKATMFTNSSFTGTFTLGGTVLASTAANLNVLYNTSVTPTILSYLDATSPIQAQFGGKEPLLGNPLVTGYVLSSTTGGVRSWVAPGGDLSIYRRLNNHDSLSTLQEKAYSSLSSKPTLGTASAQDVGYFATAAQGTDARTPVSHAHGNITNVGAIGSTAALPVITTTSGVLTVSSFGISAGTFTQGNDSRLTYSDATSSIQGQLDAKINADYVIEKIASTYYARPSGSLTAYSNASASSVINSALGQLTSGGKIYLNFKGVVWDNCDSIRISYNNITIEGSDKYSGGLKIKANKDIGRTSTMSMFWIAYGVNNATFRNLQIDGNKSNQSKAWEVTNVNARICGITGFGDGTDKVLIENCYVHDFTQYGIYLTNLFGSIIRDNEVKDNDENNITNFAFSSVIERNKFSGSNSVSVSCYEDDNIVRDNEFGNMTGHLRDNFALAFEVDEGDATNVATRCKAIHNTITGTNITTGIGLAAGSLNCEISDNTIDNITGGTWCSGISMHSDSGTVVHNNKITRISPGVAIELSGSQSDVISENNISFSTMDYGIHLQDLGAVYATNNIIRSNTIQTHNFALWLAGHSTDNIIINNIINIPTIYAGTKELLEAATAINNIYMNNYAPGTSGSGWKIGWLNNTGLWQTHATATSDGLTTGLITPGSQNITVTSASAYDIITLPTASATTIGTKITGIVTANGCELRVPDTQAITVYINGVTTNVESDIPANSSFEVTCIDATHWILKAWTNLGAPITAIVPNSVSFITTWNTENAGSATKVIVIPTTGAGYDFYADWGDGSAEAHITGTAPSTTHTYATTGVKTISIRGAFPRIYFNNGGDKLKLLSVAHWGTGVWSSMQNAFYGCANLTGTYTDYPNTASATSMAQMFRGCTAFNSAVNFNTENVTDMSLMFTACTVFNQSVATFNTVKVVNTNSMFNGCAAFNQSVASFNTASIEDLSSMFNGCTVFNQSVANFNTANATTIASMFVNCAAFNQSVAGFNTTKVTSMSSMFNGCTHFNQSVAGFDVTSVTTMTNMFNSCTAFSTANYDALLISFGAQAVQNTVTLNVPVTKYTGGGGAATARAHLVLATGSGGHGWTITDAGTV